MPKLSEFLAVTADSRLLPEHSAAEAVLFERVSTDTRTLSQGALFVALEGPNFDGSKFLQAAKDKGAVAAVIRRGSVAPGQAPLLCVEVPDTLIALQQWACHWRRQWHGTVIAVTGSNGKTTVKQMIATVLAKAVGTTKAWATPGNLNNHIGVPLSVLGLQSQHQLAVLELGMNHPNEIAGLAAIAAPQVALVNNAQREHQEFMKSVAAVAHENGQVFAALSENGVAVFPKDPEHEAIWIGLAGQHRCIRFGFEAAAGANNFHGDDVIGNWADSGRTALSIRFPSGESITVRLNGAGEHFAHNVMAAAACAWAADISVLVIEEALSGFEPVAGRGKKLALRGGGILVDDTYNANPDSVRAAIDALATLPAPQALVLADMGEVGDQGEQFHCEVLRYADAKHLRALWLHGNAMAAAQKQTGLGKHFEQLERLVSDLDSWVDCEHRAGHQPSVWAKGSRFMKMERVVERLQQPTDGVNA
jgi:UDP-N-acetylmuramoyl-tripeptide--D-alanyl-D-alanine ligase